MRNRNRAVPFGTVVAAILLLTRPVGAYVLEGQKWTPNRTVVMQLSLGGPQQLSDGSSSFNQVAQDALNVWNQYLVHLKFGSVPNSPVTPNNSDDEMSAFFSNKVFGDTFGSGTLAVTLLNYRNNVMEETDTVFNTAYSWDSYRGPLHANEDFRRVAIHEFGHTLGLDHPDQANPKQRVSAIMNSVISDIDTVTADDISGVQSLYSAGPAFLNSANGPVLLNISTRALIGTGQNVLIGGFIIQGSQPATVIVRGIGYSLAEAGISNPLSDPEITVYDSNNQVVATNDDWFTSTSAQTIASYHLDPHNSIESALILTLNPGAYTAIVESFSNSTQPAGTGVGLFELYDLHTTGGRAGNVSSRGQVQPGDNALIGGFIIGGSGSKEVIVRAIGPSLGGAGIIGPLSDPTLNLHDGNGNLLQTNDDWQQSPNAATISSHNLAPSNPKESAIYANLGPGNYTAIVRGVNNASGVGLVEVYDLSAP